MREIIKAGMRPIQTNWRGGRGELDIIAFDRRTLVAVEVKTRRLDLKRGFAAINAVDLRKREMLHKSLYRFRRNNGPLCRRYAIKYDRVDAVEVYYSRTWFGCLKTTEIRLHRGISTVRGS
jgi:Holliday junction resolvase-like predicted endonuclease